MRYRHYAPRKKLKITKHHILPRERGGSWDDHNILKLWNHRHEVYHILFGNKTLVEAANFLLRVDRAKKRRRHERAA